MESGDIITEKTEEENENILNKAQQKKLFIEKELEEAPQEEKEEIKVQETSIKDGVVKEDLVLGENRLEEESSSENIQEENLEESLEKENSEIEDKDKLKSQEDSINIEKLEENIVSEEKEIEVKKTLEVEEEPEVKEEETTSETLEKISENETVLEKSQEKEKVEIVVEDLEEKREAKDITITTDNSMLVESGLEIQYTSLHLNNFPISYSNFSNELSFNEVISIGTSAIKIGETLLNNTSLKILVYNKFKLLEIKTREFKVALSIDLLNGETLVKNGDFYKYEIFNKIKNSRFIEVINIFKEIFSGAKIEFKFKKLVGDITFENRIEVYKFNLLQELANSYKNIVSSFSLNREKNFAEVTNSFYEVFLTEAILEGKKIDSWINFRLKNDFDIQAGDNLTFERIHKLDFKGINFDIKEIIKVKSEVSEREFTKDNEICGYRRAVEISLKKVEKFN
ncbi:hypothetical protein [uncultured Fusobacterium sp.]|uniref:hypothetical protein n=1 Tax=uncultured Fusobacterium sp. TaxID=159267 RepID=UPI0025EDCCC8|nr:hypothetical protein [uncultured Fusobacterium sp.]